jgi:uroporphyrinogen decarboxylase
MTSRERVLKAINHQEPDRVPYDLAGTTVTSINKKAFVNAMKSRGLSTEFHQKEIDPVQQIVTPIEQTLVALKSDTRRIGARRIPNFEDIINMDDEIWEFKDQWHCTWRMNPAKDLYFYQIAYPIEKYANIEKGLEDYEFPQWSEHIETMQEDLSEQAQYLMDYCGIADRNCAGLTEMSVRIRGYEKWYIDTLVDKKGVDLLLNKVLEHKMEYWTSLISWIKENQMERQVQVVSECDDLGTKKGTLIDPITLRDLVIPKFKELWDYIKSELPNVKIFMHNEGAIFEIIEDLVDAGMDIYNPVDFNADNMQLEVLKKEFGKDLVFWGGGVDTTHTLLNGTEEEVKDEVKRVLDILAPGGGFVFSPIHNILEDVPPNNFWAMWDTLMEHGKY